MGHAVFDRNGVNRETVGLSASRDGFAVSNDFAPMSSRVRKPEPVCHVPQLADANGSTTRAEYPADEGIGIPIDSLGTSEVEGPIDRASPAEIHSPGHNWAGTDEGPFRKEICGPRKRGTLNSPSGNPRPLGRGGCQSESHAFSALGTELTSAIQRAAMAFFRNFAG